ncbi:MAG: polyprenyl diphosphate synthase [Patescibacteria group bacterium]|nr:polyprenyl diphosphate synthase [Patescibacteria group bacterium]
MEINIRTRPSDWRSLFNSELKFRINKIPSHIVLFPDGNRRWARRKGLPIFKGYWQGYQNLIRFFSWAKKRKIKVLTTFGFSTENWQRPKKEVDYLMKLFEKTLKQNLKKFQETGVKVKVIGQKENLPKSLKKTIEKIENSTKNNKKFYLNLAVSYGGKWDILQAIKKIVRKKIPAEKITEDLITNYLSTSGLPEPDLIIRAGGEQRLSNFLLWQAAYSELYFSKKYWPDFKEKDFNQALQEYDLRKRRFGK